ncbi:SDR family oxidoreductase [Nocardiopsis kunsanensis]|uniref:SDR family oxidoreductase n=1 Tax=Nocardiopsis kunsanensis TaxID=141693 RepID=UPI000366A1A5|nr:SDR family oxidoreductase [Nocardiopsis kunsanensis]
MTRRGAEESDVAVVCGASGGVGRATARELARRGYSLGLLARGSEGLGAAAEEARSTGVRVYTAEVDVADGEAVQEAAERAEAELGPVTLWVNAAFATLMSRFVDSTPEEFRRVTDVCYHGTANGTRAALNLMEPRDRGTIVQVGSALAYRGIPLQSAYCGAKHAVRGFTDSVRAELVDSGSRVRITEVHLPGLNTPQFSWVRTRTDRPTRPMAPVYQPEVAGRAIAWAAEHPRRRTYWVAPSTVQTALGQRVAPRVLDLILGRTEVDGQLREGEPEKEGNLFRPFDADRDYGAHGVFDDESRGSSVQQWLNERRLAVTGTAIGLAAVGAVAWRRARA